MWLQHTTVYSEENGFNLPNVQKVSTWKRSTLGDKDEAWDQKLDWFVCLWNCQVYWSFQPNKTK